jgi:hypothetical protein
MFEDRRLACWLRQDSVERHVSAQADLRALADGYSTGTPSGCAFEDDSIEQSVEQRAFLAGG